MYQDFNNPSYYRAHQFKEQLELPSGALKNRSIPQYYSQIPQGRQFFEPTNKKHYQTLAQQSQIQQQGLMQEQLTEQQIVNSRIAMDKSYFRSLNVEDIQGAKPNTLISKAVKNKHKAHQLKNEQLRQKQQEKPTISNQGYFQQHKVSSNGSSLLNQYQAQQKLRRFKIGQSNQNKQISPYSPHNFHFSSRQIQKNDINSQNSNNQNLNEGGYEQQYQKNRIYQQQRRIKQLQKQLALQKSRGKQTNSITQETYERSNQINSQFQRQNIDQRNKQLSQLNAKYQSKNKQNQYNYHNNNYDYTGNVKMQKIQNEHHQPTQGYHKPNQQPNQQYTSIRQEDLNLNRQRVSSNPYMHHPKPNSRELYQRNNLNNNRSIQNLSPGESSNYMNLQANRSLMFEDKNQHRKYNPTFLSYGGTNGINSISMAGKNIVNQ